jgi:outer membrane protein assembly factor BamB
VTERTHPRHTRRALLGAVAACVGLAGCGGLVDTGTEDCPPYDPVEPTAGWTGRFGGGGNRALAAGGGPAPGTEPAWTSPLETSAGYHAPLVADGTVYAHDREEVLVAVDATTGEVRWTADLDPAWVAPALGEEHVVVPTEPGVTAFDRASGERRWNALSSRAVGFDDGAPTVAGGIAYVPVGVSLYALDAATGKERWRFVAGMPAQSTPAVRGRTAYVGFDDAYLRALDGGEKRWRTKVDGPVRTNVSVADGLVVAGTTAGTVYGLAPDGEVRWTHRLPDRERAGRPERPETVTTDGSRVYVTTDRRLRVLDTAGSVCWEYLDHRAGYATGVAVTDGVAYVTGPDGIGVLGAVDGENRGSIGAASFRVSAGPTVAEGGLFAAGGGVLARY